MPWPKLQRLYCSTHVLLDRLQMIDVQPHSVTVMGGPTYFNVEMEVGCWASGMEVGCWAPGMEVGWWARFIY